MNTIVSSDYVEISDSDLLPEKPVVSVHMLAYNHGPYLAEAIEGVIAQKTDFPIELVIGEDCSTDNTRDIALDYQRRYPGMIRVIFSERNVGMIANFRRVRAACRGDFIAFCEGDDYWIDSRKLQKQINVICEDNIVGVATDCLRKVGSEIVFNDFAVEINDFGYVTLIGMLHGNKIKTPTVMYKKEITQILMETKFDNWPFADYLLHLHALSLGKVRYLSDVTAVYRLTPGSATRKSIEASLCITSFALECSMYFARKNSVSHDVVASIEAKHLRRMYGLVYATGDRSEFLRVSKRLRVIGFRHERLVKHFIRLLVVGTILQPISVRVKQKLGF